jgi:hypothetical protein
VPDLVRLHQLRAMRRTLSDRLACGSGQPVPASWLAAGQLPPPGLPRQTINAK